MPDSRPRLHRIVSISGRRRTKGSQPSSSHPLHTISIHILLLLLLAFVLLMVGPASGQATCAFLGQLPQFAGLQQLQPADLPKEPLLPTAANVLRICEPTGPSCCTARLEAQLEQLEKLQLEEGIRSQLRLVRRFLQKTATNFRDEFRMALHNSASLLRRLFRLTYGHFFVQHQRIFDNYFAELADLFTENGSGDFGEATQKLFQSIFVAEFALLNPMRLIDANAERCLLAQQLPLGPFGTVPTTVNNLLARTFRVWTSLIKAVDKAGSQLEALEKAFSLPPFCPPALVRMRHCHFCSPNPLPESRPCPNLCQNVLGGCLHELARLGPAWELAIDTLLRLSADLHSVHDPHLALAPLPVQISEAIMHFQERGPLLSSRILFRCFGQEFQRMVGRSDEPKVMRRRRRRREMEANGTEQLSEEDEESSDESNLVDDIQLELNDFHNVQSTRDMVEQFREGVLRLRGFWAGLSRAVCQEGGMRAAGHGDRCWNGTAMSRYRWRLAGPGMLAGNPEFRHLIRSVEDRFSQEREAIFALAESLATRNGWTLERPREQNVTEECERPPAEEDGGGMSPDDEDSMEASGDDSSDYEEEEERQQFWQRQKDVQRRRWNFGGGGGANAGASGRNGILFSWTLLTLIFFVYFLPFPH